MAKFINPRCSLLLILLCVTSVNGQTKTEQASKTADQQLSFTSQNTKLSKTQGSNKYQGISCGLEDRKGNIWFGTGAEGVFCYDGKRFTQFTVDNGLSSNSVRSMLEDKTGKIWFATDKGICYYDGKTIQQISKLLDKNDQSNYSIVAKIPLMNDVYSIMQDKKGMLWFGTADGILNYDGNKFTRFLDTHFIKNESNLTLKSVQCMLEDKNGNLWFGSGPMAFEGIAFFDGKTLTNFKPQNETWIRKITENKDGTVLFTTRHIGMISFNGKNFTDFPEPENLRKDLLNFSLTDSKDNIWYASDYTNDNDPGTGGFWKFDRKSFAEFTKKEGLSNTSVTFILEDRKGNIWIGTRNSELYRYDGKTFETFSE